MLYRCTIYSLIKITLNWLSIKLSKEFWHQCLRTEKQLDKEYWTPCIYFVIGMTIGMSDLVVLAVENGEGGDEAGRLAEGALPLVLRQKLKRLPLCVPANKHFMLHDNT